jgi:hypothetical protein
MQRTPKYSLLALAFGALSLGWSPPVSATVPCPLGAESGELTLESVTVDGQPQTDLSAYAPYHLSLSAVPYGSGQLVLQANASPIYIMEEYANAP